MTLTLDHLHAGQSARIVELRSSNPARLDRLSAYGLVPGSVVRMEQRSPAIIFRVDETELSVERSVAADIVVTLI